MRSSLKLRLAMRLKPDALVGFVGRRRYSLQNATAQTTTPLEGIRMIWSDSGGAHIALDGVINSAFLFGLFA